MLAGLWRLARRRWRGVLARAVHSLALAAMLLADAPHAGAQSTTDYDLDGDGLIEVSTLAQLDAVRHDLDGDGDPAADEAAAYGAAFPGRDASAGGRMGCPSGSCSGYELAADLDFDENGDGAVTSADSSYWNGGAGWDPIGEDTFDPFDTVFLGNGHTISHLFVNRPSADGVGLFGTTGDLGSSITGVGLLSADVTGRELTGGLAGDGGGPITASYVTGKVSGSYSVGGLAGYSIGDITACWSSASVSASTDTESEPQVAYSRAAGGLVGEVDSATVSASYATGPVAGGSVTGGLVGNLVAGAIEASWAAGPVAGAVAAASGGLTGANDVNDEVFEGETYTASYWDAGVSGRGASGGGLGKTTRELQSPSGYSGLYAAWNLDLDGDGSGDSPWNFGAGGQYPALAYGGLDPADQRTAWIRSGHRDAPVAGEPVVAGLADAAARASAGDDAPSSACGAAGVPRKRAWKWERSGDGASGWTDVSASNGSACSYVYVPSDADAGKRLRASVPLAAGGRAVTTVTAAVRARSGAAAASARFAGGHSAPRAGRAVAAARLPAHRDRSAWRWLRCDGAGATASCATLRARSPSWSHTPTAADAGRYLRAFVYYEDASTGVWTRASTPSTARVAAAGGAVGASGSAHPCALDPAACGIH